MTDLELQQAKWLREQIDDWLRNSEQFGIIEILHGDDDSFPGYHQKHKGFAITRILDAFIQSGVTPPTGKAGQ